MAAEVSYFWDFGNGETSTEKDPVILYRMAGKYTLSRTVYYDDGSSATNTETIRVYEFDYSGGLYVSFTNRCFAVSVAPHQGVGVVPWGGDGLLSCCAYTGAAKGLTRQGVSTTLVFDNAEGRFYTIGKRGVWKDKVSQYNEYPIPTVAKLKEITSNRGEWVDQVHRESHVYIRPWDEDYKDDISQYVGGFLPGFDVSLRLYKDGQSVESAGLQKIARGGDYNFFNKVQAKRLQLEIRTTESAFRVVGVNQIIDQIDEKVGPASNYPVETQYQAEFALQDVWFSRSISRPLLNRASGATLVGTYYGQVVGPDGVPSSAFDMIAANSLTSVAPYISGSFTASVWIASAVLPCSALWFMGRNGGGNGLSLTLYESGGHTMMRVASGAETNETAIQWNTTDWIMLSVVRNASEMLFYVNGELVERHPTIAGSFGAMRFMSANNGGYIFDGRRVLSEVSASALRFMYNDITANGGKGGLLPAMS